MKLQVQLVFLILAAVAAAAQEVAFEDQPCLCQCDRGNGRPGVLLTKVKGGAAGDNRCVRYEAVKRRIGKERVECVSEAACTAEAVADAVADDEVDERADGEDGGQTTLDVCQCRCRRSRNHYGVWIRNVKRNGEIQCAREGRAGRSVNKERSECVPLGECPPSNEDPYYETGGMDDEDEP